MPAQSPHGPILNQLIIHTDGGSRGNPGPAATGIVIYNSNYEVIHKFGRCIGVNTNNVAEYTAVIDALDWLLAYQPPELIRTAGLIFKLDSQLVVEQLSGRWKVKDSKLQLLKSNILSLIATHQLQVTFTYVPRAQNAAADLEVNRALDSQTSSRA